MGSHVIDIEDCDAGVYTKVRKQLNKTLGSPEAWDYEKPTFSVEASDTDFAKLQASLGGFEGIRFSSTEESEETASAPAPEVTEEAPPAPPAPEPPAEPAEPAEVVDYSKYRC